MISALPNKYIHPLLRAIFDDCCLGDRAYSSELSTEVLSLVKGLPREDTVYAKTVVESICRSVNEDEKLRVAVQKEAVSVFYQAVIGHVEIFEEWLKEDPAREPFRERCRKFFIAIQRKIREKPNIAVQEILFVLFLRLIRWEWEDRLRMFTQILDFPFYVEPGLGTNICLGFAHYDETFRDQFSILIGDKLLRCPPEELSRKMGAMKFDLASFCMALQQMKWTDNKEEEQYRIQNARFYQAFFQHFSPIETDVMKRLHIMLIFLSNFPKKAFVAMEDYLYLTQLEYRQLRTMARENDEELWISPREYFQFIICMTHKSYW
jgi:hypothetical protein